MCIRDREDTTVSDRCSPKDRREAEGFALRRKGDPMTDINAKGLSRRAFFGLGATAAAGAAVAGLDVYKRQDPAPYHSKGGAGNRAPIPRLMSNTR